MPSASPATPGAPRVVAVLGSARGDGHTARVLDAVLEGARRTDPPAAGGDPGGALIERVDLGALQIADYDYDQSADDDFLGVARAMADADAVVFATPVYWYAMSAPLKRLFDRLTDLVTVRKPLGRQLAGRQVWLVASGADPALPDGFEVPFRSTATYLDMDYRGAFYASVHGGGPLTSEAERRAAAFGATVCRAASAHRAGSATGDDHRQRDEHKTERGPGG